MRFVNPSDGGVVWPAESVAHTHSADGVLLDTGWLLNWPGPGQVYLSDGDIIDIVIPAAAERLAVQEALKSAGWTEPDATAGKVAELEATIAELSAELADAKISEAGFDAALKKLQAAKPASSAHKKAGS